MKKLILLLILSTIAFSYKVKPLDTLGIEVYTSTGRIISKTVKVDEEGFAPLPFAGRNKVVGIEIEEIEYLINEAIRSIFPKSVVNVFLVKPAPEYVYFHGVVTGIVDLSQMRSRDLVSILSTFGTQFNPYKADLRAIRIIRKDRSFKVDLENFFKNPDELKNIELMAGDIVIIPKIGKVGIFGAVVRPGFVDYHEGMDILDLITFSGGLSRTADKSSITVYRGKKSIQLNFNDIVEGKENFPLEDGDVVYVPTMEIVKVYIDGFVRSPGMVSFMGEDPTLSKAIVKAGGISDPRKVENIEIIRNGIILEASTDTDMKLEDGDMIKVIPFDRMRIYLVGVVSKYVEFYEDDIPTLRKILARIGFHFSNSVVYSVSIVRKQKSVFKAEFTDPSGVEDFPLKDGDVIFINQKNPTTVYVTGAVLKPGIVQFSPFEKPNLKALMYKVSPSVDKGRIYLSRSGKITIYDLEDVLKGKTNPSLKMWDLIYVEPLILGKVWIVGGSVEGGIDIGDTVRSLSDLLGYISVDPKEVSNVELVRKDGERKIYHVEDILLRKEDVKLEDGDLIVLRKKSQIKVYVLGDVAAEVIFEPGEKLTIDTLLAKLRIPENTIEKIEGNLEDEFIKIHLKKTLRVFVTGEVETPGMVEIAPDEPKDLKRALMKVGVTVKKGMVKIIRNGEEFSYDLENVMSGLNSVNIEADDYILVESLGFVNVIGAEPDKVRLEEATTVSDLVRILRFQETPEKVEIFRKDETIEFKFEEAVESRHELFNKDIVVIVYPNQKVLYVVGDLSKVLVFEADEDINKEAVIARLEVSPEEVESMSGEFKDGGVVKIKLKKVIKIFVTGEVETPGMVEIAPDEPKDLKSLLVRVGVRTSDEIRVKVISKSGVVEADFDDVMKNEHNPDLETNSLIIVYRKDYAKVAVEGFGIFEIKDGFERLSDVLGIEGLNVGEISEITLWREGVKKSFKVEDVLRGFENPKLKDGDFISFSFKKQRKIYVVGDVSAVIYFDWDEPVDEETLIAKLEIPKENIAEISGDIKDNAVVKIFLKKPVRIYVSGALESGGVTVEFSPDEMATMKNLLAKIGKLSEDVESVELYREGRLISEMKVEDIFRKDFMLFDRDFVRFVRKKIYDVYVFGEGVVQGLYALEEGKNNLRELVALIGGIEKDVVEVSIYRKDGIKTFNISQKSIPNVLLEDDDMIVFGKSQDRFVYVLGDVNSPGAIYVGAENLSLVNVLGLAGGLNSWAQRSKIIVKRGAKEFIVDTSDFESISNFKVKGGDVIYVPPVEYNRVYVLGAVENPGIVYIDRRSRLLDVILRSGGFSKRAILSKIYVFRGGVEGPVEIHDLSWFKSGKSGENPEVNPGDIVFVPDDPMLSLTDTINLVNTFLGFINNVVNTYKNVKGVVGW